MGVLEDLGAHGRPTSAATGRRVRRAGRASTRRPERRRPRRAGHRGLPARPPRRRASTPCSGRSSCTSTRGDPRPPSAARSSSRCFATGGDPVSGPAGPAARRAAARRARRGRRRARLRRLPADVRATSARRDCAAAVELRRRGGALGRRYGDPDLLALGLSAQAGSGSTGAGCTEGLALFDEAMVGGRPGERLAGHRRPRLLHR